MSATVPDDGIPEPVEWDLPALTDPEEWPEGRLAALMDAAEDELDRRYTLATAPIQAEEAAARYQAAIGRKDGDPWVQPQGRHDAYAMRAIVTRDGKTWRSKIPNNPHMPGDPDDPQSYRWWEDITAPVVPPSSDPQPWSGAGVQYAVDNRVTHEGFIYRVVIAHTSQPDWPPHLVNMFVREGPVAAQRRGP